MAEANFRLPPSLDLSDPNLSEAYIKWKRQLDVYLLATGAPGKDDKVHTAIILHCGGTQLIEAYEHFQFAEAGDKHKPAEVLKKSEEYCTPKQNIVMQTFRFWTIPFSHPFDSFLTELRTRAESCKFEDMKERMIRDKIVFTVSGKLQELLLRESEKLDLKRTIEICRSYELSLQQAKEISSGSKSGPRMNINKLIPNQHKPKKPPATATNSVPSRTTLAASYKPPGRTLSQHTYSKECKFCGYKHKFGRDTCPAWGKTCEVCHKKNHFKRKCPNSKLHSVEKEEEFDETEWLKHISLKGQDHVTALMIVNDCEIRFQLDSGADVNTIKQKFVKKEQVKPTTQSLIMWNKSRCKPLGETTLPVTNPRTDEITDVKFIVVQNDFNCLLGLNTVKSMGLITVNDQRFIARVETEIQSDLGDLGVTHLYTDPNVKPKTLPCRRIPVALVDQVKQEIETLLKRGVLIAVEQPTDWVSQMAVVKKPNGKLRLCIDPQPLNVALKREHFKLPTFEDVLPYLGKARLFTKLDVKEAFWHVRLDEESSLLTTMITPYGRFRWARLPFGLKVSSEIFQKRLMDALCDLDGLICIADDILVIGCGDTDEEAEKDHDLKMAKLRKRCHEQNIKLNETKSVVKAKELTFIGHRITTQGVKPDENKVKAITNMPAPEDVHGVKRLCGMVQYLAKFIPNLASELEPIRNLVRKDSPWDWSPQCESAFQNVKKSLGCCNTNIL